MLLSPISHHIVLLPPPRSNRSGGQRSTVSSDEALDSLSHLAKMRLWGHTQVWCHCAGSFSSSETCFSLCQARLSVQSLCAVSFCLWRQPCSLGLCSGPHKLNLSVSVLPTPGVSSCTATSIELCTFACPGSLNTSRSL